MKKYYKANLGEKISQNQFQYLPNLQNIILNNITYDEVPVGFGKSELKFNLANYKFKFFIFFQIK